MDLATEPIVRETSLAAHGSLAPVAGGPARTAKAAPGTAAAISPARSLRRLVAVPIVMGHSLGVCEAGVGREHLANGYRRRPVSAEPPRYPRGHPTSCHPGLGYCQAAATGVRKVPLITSSQRRRSVLATSVSLQLRNPITRHNPQAAAVFSPARIARDPGE